jgi:cell division protein FtsL
MRKSNCFKICKFEKKLVKCCLVLLLLFPVVSLLSKSILSNMNIEVETIKKDISSQKKKVESLSMKVDEMKSMANLESIIESEGLSYNSTNVKVIMGN